MFNAWSTFLPPAVELFLIHLPGRDRRIKEPLHLQLMPLAQTLAEALVPWLDKPFAFFGHSMGALLSFEVARHLRGQFALTPRHLFVSGRQPPHIPDPNPELRHLSEQDFIQSTQKFYGALPEVILQDQDMLHLFMTIMRADITMIETYAYQHDAPLDCPISAFGGWQDPSTSEQSLGAWREQTSAAFQLHMLPGHHFFIQTARPALLQLLNDEFNGLLKA